jgi:hypothetical protein
LHSFSTDTIFLLLGPLDRKPLDLAELSHTRIVENIIAKMKAKCTHHDSESLGKGAGRKKKAKVSGCAWTGMLRDRNAHSTSECMFSECACSFEGCGEKMQRSELEKHAKECEHRVTECDDCSESMRHSETAAHDLVIFIYAVSVAVLCE